VWLILRKNADVWHVILGYKHYELALEKLDELEADGRQYTLGYVSARTVSQLMTESGR
jgi:hypothetical protein